MQSTHDSQFVLQILPLLIQLLVMRQRVSEAADLLRLLGSRWINDANKTAEAYDFKIWHAALSLEVLLESGFAIEPFE